MKINKYILLIVLLVFSLSAIYQSVSFGYTNLSKTYLLFLLFSIIILFINKYKKILTNKLFILMIIIFTAINFFVYIPNSGFGNGAITKNLRYHFASRLPGNNLIEGKDTISNKELLRQFFITYLNPVLADKEVNTDNNIYSNTEIKYLSNNLKIIDEAFGITEENVNYLKNNYKYQGVKLKTENNILEICAFTGNEWNNDKKINLYYNNNSILYVPESIKIIDTIKANFPLFYNIQDIDINIFSDKTTYNFFENNIYAKFMHIFKQIALSLYFILIGFIALFNMKKNIRYNLFYFLLYPIGVAINIIGFILLSLLALPINLISIILFHIILAFIFNISGNFLIHDNINISIKRTNSEFILLIINIIIVVVACYLSTVNQWGNDALGSLNMAQKICSIGKVGNNYLELIALSWIHTSLHTTALSFGMIYYDSLSLLLFLSCSLCFAVLVFNFSISKNINIKKSVIFTLSPILLCLSTPFIFAQFTIMLNNLAIASFIMLLCSLGVLFVLEDDSNFSDFKLFILIGLPIFFVIQLARMENILFMAISLFLINILKNKFARQLSLIGFILAFMQVIIYNIYCYGNTSLYYWTSSKGYMMLSLYFLVFIFTYFKDIFIKVGFMKYIYNNIIKFSSIIILLLFIIFYFINSNFKANLYACLGNYLGSAMYSILYMVLPLLILLSFNNKIKNLILLLISFIVYNFLGLFTLMMFNINPMYFGFSSVEMRMMLHTALINIPLYYLIVYSLEKAQNNDV